MNKNTNIASSSGGKVRISEDVVAKIAYFAAKEVDGVEDILKNLPSYVAGMIKKKGSGSGISVRALEDGTLGLDICISVRYGSVIPQICARIQENCITSVKEMTGLNISTVNVHVASVIFDE